MKYTIEQFRKDYPNDAVCLDKIFKVRFGNMPACPCCGVVKAEFKRITTRRSYQCRHCYYQIYPTAGTVFEKTRTPLIYWFYAMFLFTMTRNGVSGTELQRQLGVTYKTAWRMAHCIRDLMKNGQMKKLVGTVEVDETYCYEDKTEERIIKSGRSGEKAIVFAMVERLGSVIAKKVENSQKETLKEIIKEHIERHTKVMSDEYGSYNELKDMGYDHKTIKHKEGKYVVGEVSTNTVEGFFSILKRMIKGTHLWVSHKHLQRYINECVFRYNNRRATKPMFDIMIEQLPIFSA